MCDSGKKSYRNRKDAIRGILRCRFDRRGKLKTRNKNRREQGAYRCEHCGWWHLTHVPGAEVDLALNGDSPP